jgi:amino acid efflux transporter
VHGTATLGVWRGAALYVGALVGPGVLLVPSLAAAAAGPASILGWAGLFVFSIPLAIAFAALGVRHPVAGGVSTYVREGLGDAAAAVTGGLFLTAVFIGAPAVSLIGGFYVADLAGGGTPVAASVGLAMFVVVLFANSLGLRVSSGLQLWLSSLLIAVIVVAVAAALPSRAENNWTPFAPHGWWAAGTSASILVWLFVGWEAVAQLAGDFADPGRELPRAMGLAFGIVTVLYLGLATATIAVTSDTGSRVPLADLIAVGFGRAGRDATAVLAVALTMGTMNVYVGGAAKLAAALAEGNALPGWLRGGELRSVPRRPLVPIAVVGSAILVALVGGAGSTDDLVRATSACFVGVYLLVAAFSSAFLLVPVAASVLALGVRRAVRPPPHG